MAAGVQPGFARRPGYAGIQVSFKSDSCYLKIGVIW
jgi:hypothetical protein